MPSFESKRTRSSFYISVSILLCLTISSLAFAETTLKLTEDEKKWLIKHPVVKFTGDPNWLPYEAFDEQGNYIGIVSEHILGGYTTTTIVVFSIN